MFNTIMLATGRQFMLSGAALAEWNSVILKQTMAITLMQPLTSYWPVYPLPKAATATDRSLSAANALRDRQMAQAYALAHRLEQQRKIIRTLSERLARDASALAQLQLELKDKSAVPGNVICFADAMEQRNQRDIG